MEIQCVKEVEKSEEIIEEAYLEANPDVKNAGMSAKFHFENYGKYEPKRFQYLNITEIIKQRKSKLQRIQFKHKLNLDFSGYSLDLLTQEEKNRVGVTDHIPLSFNQYDKELIDEFKNNPDKLYLDIGAGVRPSTFSNVINTDIYPHLSTDVVCIGEDLPFADNQFDMIICIAVLEHTLKPWEVAKEISRVVKPGGKIIIDYPFLQPVHGYPHHYFNATPKGNCSLFEGEFTIDSCEVKPNQSPIFTLCWILNLWVSGLSPEEAERFKDMNLHEILSKHPGQHLEEFYCKNLDKEIEKLIPAGTTLQATKKTVHDPDGPLL